MPSWVLQGVVRIAPARFGSTARSFYTARGRVLLLAYIPHRLLAPTNGICGRHEGHLPLLLAHIPDRLLAPINGIRGRHEGHLPACWPRLSRVASVTAIASSPPEGTFKLIASSPDGGTLKVPPGGDDCSGWQYFASLYG
jgi:hypothetical protein